METRPNRNAVAQPAPAPASTSRLSTPSGPGWSRRGARFRIGFLKVFTAVLMGMLFPLPATAQPPAELFFSEYIEGSSNNKALEIFNGTGAAVNLATAGYSVQMFFNGNAAAGLTINLTGTVAAGDVYVVAHSSANAAILGQADQTNGSGWFNGNDAVVLLKNGVIIDVIGQIGFNPGTEWGTGDTSTADNTLRRKAGVTQGDANGSDVFDPAGEWDGFARDTFDGLGRPVGTGGGTLSLGATPTTFSEAAGAGAATGTVTRSGDTTSPLAVALASGDPSEATVPASVTILAGQASATFAIDAMDDAVVDGSQTVTLTASASGLADATTTVTVTDDDVVVATTRIHQIQGTGQTFDPAFGGSRTVEGVVVAAFSGSGGLNGFFVQEEDADADADPATSEGIFVYDPAGLFSGAVASRIRVTGTVTEYSSSRANIAGTGNSSLTQLSSLTSVIGLGPATLPAAGTVVLPVVDPSQLERYEGMRVTVSSSSGPLMVTETFKLGRYGQVGLSGGARLDQFTQVQAPSVSGYADHVANLQDDYIILDDGSTGQNPDPIIYARGGQPLSALNTLRGGDTVASLTGVLDERYEGYRVQSSVPVNFQATNPRTDPAPAVGGTLRVTSANLLNFFNGNGIDSDGDGFNDGGFPTARGANTAAEFKRQLDKTVEAVLGLDADVFGYNEIENDGYGPHSAVQQLVNELNANTAPGTYAVVVPPASALNGSGGFGGDEITVGFLYKTTTVRLDPRSTVAALTTGIFTQDAANRVQRPALAATFERLANGQPTTEIFTVVINHLKSKGSPANLPGDADQGDGQGFSNATRTQAAQELATWLATQPTGTADPDYLITGDLNSYRMEDPITVLTAAGYTSLFGPESYSYQFNGQWGSLDHALANGDLLGQVTGAAKWHINADEPVVLDYNVEFKSAAQIQGLYNVDPFRTSDHDPLVVGLNLMPVSTPPLAGDYLMGCWRDVGNTLATAKLLQASSDPESNPIAVTAVSAASGSGGTVQWAGATVTYTPKAGFAGSDTFTYTVTDSWGLSDEGTVTVVVRELNDHGLSVLGAPVLESGTATVRFAGIPGVTYDIQACDDLGLQNWLKIGEALAGAFGLFEFEDKAAGAHLNRYYRARSH